MQIIRGFDHISGIQFTPKQKLIKSIQNNYVAKIKGENIKSPEKQQKTIYSLNAALSKVRFPHISNVHYIFFVFK